MTQMIRRADALKFIDDFVEEVETRLPDLSRRLARHLSNEDERARLRQEIDDIVTDVRTRAARICGEL